MISISELLKHKDIGSHRELRSITRKRCMHKSKSKSIELGDSVESLMRHSSYKRVGRRLKQLR